MEKGGGIGYATRPLSPPPPGDRNNGTRWVGPQSVWAFYITANPSRPARSRTVPRLCSPLCSRYTGWEIPVRKSGFKQTWNTGRSRHFVGKQRRALEGISLDEPQPHPPKMFTQMSILDWVTWLSASRPLCKQAAITENQCMPVLNALQRGWEGVELILVAKGSTGGVRIMTEGWHGYRVAVSKSPSKKRSWNKRTPI